MKTVAIVTGMHRSGTSFLAKRLHDAGYAFPGPHLPASDDNPDGYFENAELVALNNALLKNAGSAWFDHTPLDRGRLSEAGKPLLGDANRLLDHAFGDPGARMTALKDPRFCRLLPWWRERFEERGEGVEIFAVFREPKAVVQSLFRRVRDPVWINAGIANPTKAYALWAAYNLALANNIHGLVTHSVTYEDLRTWNDDQFGTWLMSPEPEPGPPCANLTVPGDIIAMAELIYEKKLWQCRDQTARAPLNGAFGDLVAPSRPARLDRDGPIFTKLRQSRRVVGFVSGKPLSAGHVYRVINRIDASIGSNITTFQLDLDHDDLETAARCADMIVLFRPNPSERLERLIELARTYQARLVLDVDDLLFLPELAAAGHLAFLDRLSDAERAGWIVLLEEWKKLLIRVDAVWASTDVLADAARTLGRPAFLLQNGLSEDRIRQAKAIMPRQTTKDVVIGYASGSATHDRDFAVVAPALEQLLEALDHARLVVLGYLDFSLFPNLSRFGDRVRHLPPVPFRHLSAALSEFDINIAPLELNNPFCEAKSELKFFEAGLVRVPTVATSTQTFKKCINDDVNGRLSNINSDWYEMMHELCIDKNKRISLGNNSYHDTVKHYGYQSHRDKFIEAVEWTMLL